MLIDFFTQRIDQAILVLSALSAVLAVLAVSWPYLVRDTLSERMRAVEQESERLRQEERAKLDPQSRTGRLAAQKPRRVYAGLVERFGLARLTDTEPAVALLKTAGFRGRAPLVTFLAARAIGAILLPGTAVFYAIFVLQLGLGLPQLALVATFSAFAGFTLPRLYVQNIATKRQVSLRRSWPDALDLLLICVESGMSIEAAFRKVAEEIGGQSPPLAEELSLTTAELSYLSDRRQAYENLGTRTGIDSIKSTIIGLIQSEKYGTSLGQTLRVLSKESRDFRMAAAEKKAAALPPKLTVPMIIFFLPVLFAVIGAPAVIQALDAW